MSLKKYLTEAELAAVQPVTGDEFDISIRELTNIETVVVEHAEGSITIALDETAMKMLEHCGCTFEDEDEDDEEQVDELAPVIGAIGGALGRGVAAGAGALARGAAKAVVGTGLKAAHDKLDKKLFGPKPTEGDYEYDESLNDIRRLSGMPTKEPVKEEGYDTSHGSPYDRGAADSYYGRDPRPHKIVPYTGADGVKGQMQKVPLTDPAEIAAYNAGYSENDDRKDYGESTNETELTERPGDWLPAAAGVLKAVAFLIGVPIIAMGQIYKNDLPIIDSPLGKAMYDAASRGDSYAKQELNRLEDLGVKEIPMQYLEKLSNQYLHKGKLGESAEYQTLKAALTEAEYQGRKVQLGKPMQGDVKKFKVYVKDPKTGNVKKVNFGDPNMRIKKSNPARRKSFRARHNCDNPGPRTKARYWSCRKW